MVDYWFDSNFFIPARSSINYENDFKKLITPLGPHQDYNLKITKLIAEELRHFKELIRLIFNVVEVDQNEEFSEFVHLTKDFIKLSKKKEKPADISLAYAAVQSGKECFIVSSDYGFVQAKKRYPKLFNNVEIMEPTTFLKLLLMDIKDEHFREDIERLIFHYAEHFIRHLYEHKHPIERILRSVLIYEIQSVPKLSSNNSDLNAEKGPPLMENDRTLLSQFIEAKRLNRKESERIAPVKHIFQPLREYNQSKGQKNHALIIRSLYIKFSDLLEEIKSLSETPEEITAYKHALTQFLRYYVFNIHAQEAIRYFQNCRFTEGFFHFRTLLESDWNIPLSDEKISLLKLLYGLFLLNLKDFEFFEYLFKDGFWKRFTRINKIFKIISDIRSRKSSDIEELNDKELYFLFNLSQYYCNTKNELGFLICEELFRLDEEKLENFDWCEDFIRRYVRELRVNRKKIDEEQNRKLMQFIDKQLLENNTSTKFDSTYRCNEFTPVQLAPSLYREPFYISAIKKDKEFHEVLCWCDRIKSFVLVNIPDNLNLRLENAISLTITSGKIKTNNLPPKKKKEARILITLNQDSEVSVYRFEINLEEIA